MPTRINSLTRRGLGMRRNPSTPGMHRRDHLLDRHRSRSSASSRCRGSDHRGPTGGKSATSLIQVAPASSSASTAATSSSAGTGSYRPGKYDPSGATNRPAARISGFPSSGFAASFNVIDRSPPTSRTARTPACPRSSSIVRGSVFVQRNQRLLARSPTVRWQCESTRPGSANRPGSDLRIDRLPDLEVNLLPVRQPDPVERRSASCGPSCLAAGSASEPCRERFRA